ncbi:hypothetical protein SAMN05216308_10540 [Nitrosospira sp. Nsp13]|nr:hypothetical protein SAMN05216308_10540 [Nitrosospira sp. Nsp13]
MDEELVPSLDDTLANGGYTSQSIRIGCMITDRFSQLHQAFHPLPKRQGTHHLPGHGCFLIQFQPRLTIKLLHRALYGDAEAFANSLPPALPQV